MQLSAARRRPRRPGAAHPKGRPLFLLRRCALLLALPALCALLLAGCAAAVTPEQAAGLYVYEKDGFGGGFTVWLQQDGSFTYYEGGLSSYIGCGRWQLEADIVTLRDETKGPYRFVNRFQVRGGGLVFLAEGSTNFLYVKVQDGDRFAAADPQSYDGFWPRVLPEDA